MSALQADVQRRAAGLPSTLSPAPAASSMPGLGTPEKGRQPGQPSGQASPPSQQKLSPGRQRMVRELAEVRQWLAEAQDHRTALQLQQQELQVRAATALLFPEPGVVNNRAGDLNKSQ